jgi:hypothetical protein
MTSALWAVTSRLSAEAVTAAVPPGCRKAVEPASGAMLVASDAEVLVETPAWPVAGAVHFVPSFVALTTAPYSVRLELSARMTGAWTPWVAGVALGAAAFPPPASDAAIEVDVDVFRAPAPVEAARVRARVRGPRAVLAAPWMLALSAADRGAVAPGAEPLAQFAPLAVPALSQMEADAAIARRICSPTCVAMVLGYWDRPVALNALAAEIFHPGLDLYGVWPAAIAAAGRHGLAGYLLRFPDWGAAAWCLQQGLPVIASVRYARGELTGAAIDETSGHLLVLTGCEDGETLVNDPAAATPMDVPRRYRTDQLSRVWLDRAGIGYVLFPPDRRPPRDS